MEKLIIADIAKFFSDTEKPTLIFCKWEDAVKIKENLKMNIEAATYGEFKNTQQNAGLNFFSCAYGDKTFVFIDERQTIEFLELSKNYSA